MRLHQCEDCKITTPAENQTGSGWELPRGWGNFNISVSGSTIKYHNRNLVLCPDCLEKRGFLKEEIILKEDKKTASDTLYEMVEALVIEAMENNQS